MARPTAEELAARRKQMAAVNNLGGALPTQTNTASPALTGAPPSVTGGVGTSTIPPMQSGGPPLAPSPSPGGNAQVEGAPLSQDGANERQGGAGANLDLDLVKDRGTPEEFHQNNLMEAGSQKATQLVADIAGGNRAGGDTGMNQEDINRQGTRANKALGMDTPEKAQAVVNSVVLDPLGKTIKSEIDSEDIDAETGLTRMAQTQLQVTGAQTPKEVEAAVNEAAKRTGVKDKGVIGRTKDAVVKWWNKGKNNPNEQVTGFMGGMNRQELGMFVFQWGAMMMANSSQGLGPAMGMAGMGAMAGHQKRGQDAAEAARADEMMDLKRRGMALEESALAATTKDTDQGVLKWNPKGGEDGLGAYEPMLTEEGEPYMPSTLAGRPSTKDWEIKQWQAAFPDMTIQEATERALSGVTPEQAVQDAESAFSREFTSGEVFVPGKGRVRARDLTEADKKAYIDNRVRGASVSGNTKPALRGGGGTGATNTAGGKLTRQQYIDGGGNASDYEEYSKLFDLYGG